MILKPGPKNVFRLLVVITIALPAGAPVGGAGGGEPDCEFPADLGGVSPVNFFGGQRCTFWCYEGGSPTVYAQGVLVSVTARCPDVSITCATSVVPDPFAPRGQTDCADAAEDEIVTPGVGYCELNEISGALVYARCSSF